MPQAADQWRERGLRDAAVRGDVAAWQALLESAYDSVRTYIHWRCGPATDLADDVQQETWLLAARKVAAFDPARAAFATWVSALAANVLRNALRSRKRRTARFAPLSEFAAAPEVPVADDRVAFALDALPEHYELVLKLKYLDGLAVDAIADLWKQSPKAVESLLTRARQAFREAYPHDG